MATIEDTSHKLIVQAVVNYRIAHDGNVFGENAPAVYTVIYEDLLADRLHHGLSMESIEEALWNHAIQEVRGI